MWKNWDAERGISEEARSFKSCESNGNERPLQGSPPGSFSLEFDAEAGVVSERSSEVEIGSTTPIDLVLQALSIRERLMREEQDGGEQDHKPRTPDYKNFKELGTEKIDELPDILLDSNTPQVPWKIKKYADTYEMEKYKKNAMIIFNHKDFLGKNTTRAGTMQDEKALKTTFEMFNFEVESHLDLHKKTLLQELKKFCSKDFREYGCVCVAILTHGSNYGYLKAHDTRYSEHEIIECFDVLEHPTLFGKPIIILIQACRGGAPATSCNPGTSKLELDVEMDCDDYYDLPTESNMVIFHSSYVGRASAREVLKGSWFIQTLCEQIKLLAAVEDFESICRAVRQEVALDKEHKMILNNKPVIVKQMPVLTTTLLRLLYLRKYEGDIEDEPNPKEPFEKEKKASKAEGDIQYSECVKRCLRDIKQTGSSLDSVERHNEAIDIEIRRLVRRMHPAEAKIATQQIVQELKTMEQMIHEMLHDVHAVKVRQYPQALEMQRRVQLHERWLVALQAFTGRRLPRLSSVLIPVQQTTVRRETFQYLTKATKWCKKKLNNLHKAEYGSDLPGVQHELDRYHREHKQIDLFHSVMEQWVHDGACLPAEVLALYSQVQKLSAELLSTSTKRMSELDALKDFLKSATAEQNWFNEREKVELFRDWADPHINLRAVGDYLWQLDLSVHKQILRVSNVIDRGEALIAQHHPATKTIETNLQLMRSQRAWELTLCLGTHLRHTTQHHNFFEEVKEAEKWIQKREETLNSTFSQSELTLDQGERLLKGMQELREELNSHGGVVSRLVEEAQTVRPVKQRRAPVTRPLRAETVCDYKHGNVAIDAGSEVTVVDNSGRGRWLVRLGGAGTEAQLPAYVLALLPPAADAQDAAARLRSAYDRAIQLWQKTQWRTRQNVMFATIKVVNGWSFSQLLKMGAKQRQVIRCTLNEDADKLFAEGDAADPQMKRLRREIDDINQHFERWTQ